jgi:hypothetical protein
MPAAHGAPGAPAAVSDRPEVRAAHVGAVVHKRLEGSLLHRSHFPCFFLWLLLTLQPICGAATPTGVVVECRRGYTVAVPGTSVCDGW